MATEHTRQQLEGTLGDLSTQVADLVRQEVQAVRGELTEKALAAGLDAGMLVAAGLLAYVGFLSVVTAIVLALARILPAWLAALVVGATLSALSYPLAKRGLAGLTSRDLIPARAINTLKHDVGTMAGEAADR